MGLAEYEGCWTLGDLAGTATATISGIVGATGACSTIAAVSSSVPAMVETSSVSLGDATGCPTGPPHGFVDVPASSFAAADITCIKALGITTGTSPSTYSPARNVTREQMAAFLGRLWRALGHTCPTAPHGFVDVPASSFANGDVGCIKALGITTGTSATTYSPSDNVTREQMAAFLGRLIRRSSEP